MAAPLPYLISNKNVPTLFEKIASAKIPEKFNRDFLQTTIGLKASNDRALIPLIRNFGFIDQTGTPTQTYPLLKGEQKKAAIAAGVRKAYHPRMTWRHWCRTKFAARLTRPRRTNYFLFSRVISANSS
jgi:hypothetical protein